MKFQKLTPTQDIENSIYDDALEFIFKNNDIKNVAISGAYGAGKSSVIESYKFRTKNKPKEEKNEFLHISFANFEESHENRVSNGNGKSNGAKINNTSVEGKIINQLIHKVDSKFIPRTNFKIKRNISKIWLKAISISVIIIVFLYFIFFTHWRDFVDAFKISWLDFSTTYVSRLISGGLCILVICLLLYQTIKHGKFNRFLKRIKLAEYEIEILEDNDSYLDKYLNEILYIFDNCGVDVIVFEDVDRYNDNVLFKRLREINTLVNSKREDRPLRFFYLLKDDLFISKDRTKFFDFILPIIPVIDGGNSYDKIIEILTENGIRNDFNAKFLQDISLYIDDMRILKNIINEYLIYEQRLKGINPDKNKLFAIIAYKNIFPKDFNDLQLRRGYVYTLFQSKTTITANVTSEIDLKIQEIIEKIEAANNQLLNSIEELEAAYINLNVIIYNINNVSVNNFTTRVELIKAIKNNKYEAAVLNSNGSVITTNFEKFFKQLNSNTDYLARKEEIEIKTTTRMDELKEKLNNLLKQKEDIQTKRLFELFNKANGDDIFKIGYTNFVGEKNEFKEIKSNYYFDLIIYLIKNRYIDETYPDYMSYFYPNSLCEGDKIFLRSILDDRAKEWTYDLRDCKVILERLDIHSFEKVEVLNYVLLEYMLKNYSGYKKYIKCLVKQLEDNRSFDFVDGFLERKKEISPFTHVLNTCWETFINDMLIESNYTNNHKKQRIIDLIYHSPDEINKQNKDGVITNYINNRDDFLNINFGSNEVMAPGHDIKIIIRFLKQLNISFVSINYSLSNPELFNEIYRNNMYDITYDNIKLMLQIFYGINDEQEIKARLYTLILGKTDEPLFQYINQNIQTVMDIILEIDEFVLDDETTIISVLNNPSIEFDTKRKYIAQLNVTISDISMIKNRELYEDLLDYDTADYSGLNVMNFFEYKENKINDTLIGFIERNKKQIKFNSKDVRYKGFILALLVCNTLSDEKYECIIKGFPFYYSGFTIKGISESKMDLLLNYGKIAMSSDILVFFRDNYPDNLLSYILKNIDKYVSIMTSELFRFPELIEILEYNIKDESAIELLEYASENIPIKGKKYSDKVKAFILSNNMEVSDLPYLLVTYSQQASEIQMIIENIGVEYIQHIVQNSFIMNTQLLMKLLGKSNIDIAIRKRLFVYHIEELTEFDAFKAFNVMGLLDYARLFKQGRPEIPYNEVNRQILEELKQKEWITKFNPVGNPQTHYIAYGRKIIK